MSLRTMTLLIFSIFFVGEIFIIFTTFYHEDYLWCGLHTIVALLIAGVMYKEYKE